MAYLSDFIFEKGQEMPRRERPRDAARPRASVFAVLPVSALLLLAWSGSAAAQKEEMRPGAKFTEEEYMTLPRYCLAQDGVSKNLPARVIPEEERKYWYATMGEAYHHIHHYCIALMLVRRGNASSRAMDRDAHYRAAIENFNYSIRRSSDAFPLKPEFHLRKGMALRLLRNDAEASGEFRRAIMLKADYSPAYTALADLLVDLGQRKEALDLLETGLQHAPDSKVLATKKAELQSIEGALR
jgi:tetratricopeptide (TPR) repeat protein